VSNRAWRSLFETERDILGRRLRGWLKDRRQQEGSTASFDRIEQERQRESLASTVPSRARRLSSIVGWSVSSILHLILIALVFPSLFKPPPVEAERTPVQIRFITKKLPTSPEPAITPIPAPKKTDPIAETEPEPVPESVESDPPEKEVVTEAPAEPDSPPEEVTAHPEVVLGTHSGATRRGSSALGSRYSERAEALRVYGGGSMTEEVVQLGLEWLARHQDDDGSWDPHGYSRHCRPGISCPGSGFPEYRPGVTGLALLAFLGAGFDHRTESPFRRTVASSIRWLLAHQLENGCFGEQKGQYLYNHGIATLALAEAAILTKDASLLEATSRGVRFIERTQQKGGGWDYTGVRTHRNDLSVTGWLVMALHTASAAGVLSSSETMIRLERYLKKAVQRNGSAIYADRGTGAGRRGISIAAVGLLSKLYLGWSPRSTETTRSAIRLVREGPNPDARVDWEKSYQSLYYWYYGSLALFHIGGDPWEAWNHYLRRNVIPLQSREGETKGSFDPDPNWIGAAGGRVTSTALGVLTFEVYYRYTPLFRKLGFPSRGERSDGPGRTATKQR